MRALARLRALARRLYPEVPQTILPGSLLVAMSANLLGLGNACTLGLRPWASSKS